MTNEKKGLFLGVVFIALMAAGAFWFASLSFFQSIKLSAMIIGILMGMLVANTLGSRIPTGWTAGVNFSAKKLLRLGIILYGFRLTLSDITNVGLSAIAIDALVVVITIVGGIYLGKLLKIDPTIALLTSTGSAICGAAAVLGAEATLKAKPYQTAVAVSTVVIFGTIAMFLYPIIYETGILGFSEQQEGVYIGCSVHEVAHVVGASGTIGGEVPSFAIITKMIRVIMLVPVLFVFSFFMSKSSESEGKGGVQIPWFAILFLVVIGINSFGLFSEQALKYIEIFDTFLLTMAMVALGVQTTIDKFKKAGSKPFVLALILFVWLIFGGYGLVKILM